MRNLREKIMAASFGRLLKRWIIAALCVVLLGGGVSAALLAPQIQEAVTAVQTVRRQKDRWEHSSLDDGYDREGDGEYHQEEHRYHFDVEDLLRAGVGRPSIAAAPFTGVTALLCGLLALTFWLLAAAWLYQAATLSGMNGPLWGVLELLGNVFAAAPFAIVRGFLRRKCPACVAWQDRTAAYCTVCGGAMRWKCQDCGAECPADARFCRDCGAERKGTKGGTEC